MEVKNFSENLVYLTKDIIGIGGQIKSVPEHFSVEEIPAYNPSGEGEHVYVSITRESIASTEMQKKLSELFGIHYNDIGFAGLKDKHARTTQVFSLLIKEIDMNLIASKIAELGVKVNWIKRHKNKLKPGHLDGNLFQILVLHPHPDHVLKQAEKIRKILLVKGVPNYFGMQRFGVNGNNHEEGKEILFGRKKLGKWINKFLISAYQSSLFNLWLADRIRNGLFDKILEGDVAMKEDSGGAFVVENLNTNVEQRRLDAGEISITGPIFGYRMKKSLGKSGEIEERIFSDEGLSHDVLKKAGLKGVRRSARIVVKEINIENKSNGLLFSFTLPKAAYATCVLREFMKIDGL